MGLCTDSLSCHLQIVQIVYKSKVRMQLVLFLRSNDIDLTSPCRKVWASQRPKFEPPDSNLVRWTSFKDSLFTSIHSVHSVQGNQAWSLTVRGVIKSATYLFHEQGLGRKGNNNSCKLPWIALFTTYGLGIYDTLSLYYFRQVISISEHVVYLWKEVKK